MRGCRVHRRRSADANAYPEQRVGGESCWSPPLGATHAPPSTLHKLHLCAQAPTHPSTYAPMHLFCGTRHANSLAWVLDVLRNWSSGNWDTNSARKCTRLLRRVRQPPISDSAARSGTPRARSREISPKVSVATGIASSRSSSLSLAVHCSNSRITCTTASPADTGTHRQPKIFTISATERSPPSHISFDI